MFSRNILAGLLCLCCLAPTRAYAEPDFSALQSQIAQLTETVRLLTVKVDEQAREIQSLKDRRLLPSPEPALASPPVSGRPGLPKFLEIGAVVDVAAKLDSPKEDGEGADRVQVREVELVLGAHVDPYSRLDSTIAFTEEEGAELEEAYLTRFELPFDLTARVGRFKPRLGKAIAVHRDSLDTVDEPLVVQRYFGVEGMSKTGVDLKKILDLPTGATHELTAGVLEGGNGEEGTAFGETKRRPTLYAHLKNYFDLSENTGLEIGLTDALGSRDADAEFEVNVFGLDGTLTRQLNPMQSVKLQGELFNLTRSGSEIETLVDETTGETAFDSFDGDVLGGYVLADFRFHPQWAAGLRYDNVELVDRPVDAPGSRDEGWTGYLTFYQSEFARWRAQFTHLDLTDGREDNQVWLQGTFAIGEHKHKLS